MYQLPAWYSDVTLLQACSIPVIRNSPSWWVSIRSDHRLIYCATSASCSWHSAGTRCVTGVILTWKHPVSHCRVAFTCMCIQLCVCLITCNAWKIIIIIIIIIKAGDNVAMSHQSRGRGTYTAGTVNSVPLFKVGRKSVYFPSHFWWPDVPKMHQIAHIFIYIFKHFLGISPNPQPHQTPPLG